MKHLILSICLLVMTTSLFAQTQVKPQHPQSTATTKAHQIANPAAYACPKCFEISKGEGSCAKCNTAKVQLGTYACLHCNKATGAKPGKCAQCSGATTQITRKYCASHGGTPLKTKGAKVESN